MNINLHNYESCFHLYVDGELDAAQMAAVEAFAAQYPHLGEVLEQLMQTIMTTPTLSMPNKSKLLRPEPWDAENLTEAQVHLLNRLEAGELAGADDRESLLLRRTLLQPEAMSMPGKSRLYREADTRRPATVWNLTLLKRVAAAAAILAAAWALWPAANQRNNQAPMPDNSGAPVAIIPTPAQAGDSGVAAATVGSTAEPATEKDSQTGKMRSAQQQKPDVAATRAPQQDAAQQLVAYELPALNTPPLPQTGNITTEPLVAITEPVQPAEYTVTEEPTEETWEVMPNDADVAAEEYVNVGGVKIKKSRFRGLVRSVSRNISRRTSAEQLQQAILPR